ncbi:MAG: apolipoprotein N-acyltransferase [Halocynthiibacter sp.]
MIARLKAPFLWITMGVLTALAQVFPDLWFVSLFGLFVAFTYVKRGEFGFKSGFLFGFGYFLTSLNWIASPFFVDAAQHGWMAPFAVAAMASGGALFWGAAGWGARRLSLGPIGFAVFLALAEFLRGHLFGGFPWALIGYIWVETPILQLAASVGPYGLTLITVVGVAAMATAVRAKSYLGGGLCVLAWLTLWGLGLALRPATEFSQHTVRLIQPNAPQHEKWNTDKIPVFFERALSLTRAKGQQAPDVVVWPETSVAPLLNFARPELQDIAGAAAGAPVLLGALRSEYPFYYNSAALIDGAGDLISTYDKTRLVPFGEYVPFGSALKSIGVTALAAPENYGFIANEDPQLMAIPMLGHAKVLICYEAVFPRFVRKGPRPDLLVQITNDAWFGAYIGPFQHLTQARFRAVEMGVPVLRAANTGISAIIAPNGALTQASEMNEAAFVDGHVPLARGETLWSRFGNLWLCVSFAVFAGSFWGQRRKDIDPNIVKR